MILSPNCVWRGSRVRVACPKFPGSVYPVIVFAVAASPVSNLTDTGLIIVTMFCDRKLVRLNKLKISNRSWICSVRRRPHRLVERDVGLQQAGAATWRRASPLPIVPSWKPVSVNAAGSRICSGCALSLARQSPSVAMFGRWLSVYPVPDGPPFKPGIRRCTPSAPGPTRPGRWCRSPIRRAAPPSPRARLPSSAAPARAPR